MAAALQEEPVMMAGSSSVAPAPSGTDRLDLEAAEQLIQLSGGADDDDGGSESRSADSVKCRGSKDKEAAVESRRRGAGEPVAAPVKDEPDSKGAAESFACSTAAGVEEKGNGAVVVESPRRSAGRHPAAAGKDRDGGIVHGEARRRPRFRSLAAIYRETEPIARRLPLAGGGGEGDADRDPPEGERKKTKKRAADEVMIPVDAGEASKAKREDRYMHACVS